MFIVLNKGAKMGFIKTNGEACVSPKCKNCSASPDFCRGEIDEGGLPGCPHFSEGNDAAFQIAALKNFSGKGEYVLSGERYVVGELNLTRINESRSPECWSGKCSIENSQFCGLSEDGHFHGIEVCQDCPYV